MVFKSSKQRKYVMAKMNSSRSSDVPMVTHNPLNLPSITHKGKRFFVDWRLEELRDVKTAKSIPFTKISGGKNSEFKARLRGLRFRTFRVTYMRGLDT